MNKDNDNYTHKTLNDRIEDLVSSMEKVERTIDKKLSVKSALLRGVAQGLGIIIGSTIVAGILYAVLTKFINPMTIQKLMLDNMVERSLNSESK